MKITFQHLLAEGWLALTIAAAGMIVRLLTEPQRVVLLDSLRRLVVALLTGLLAWAVVRDADLPDWAQALTYALCGAFAPELVVGLSKIAQRFRADPLRTLGELRRGQPPAPPVPEPPISGPAKSEMGESGK